MTIFRTFAVIFTHCLISASFAPDLAMRRKHQYNEVIALGGEMYAGPSSKWNLNCLNVIRLNRKLSFYESEV